MGVLGKAGQRRQSWFIRSHIQCLQGPARVLSDEATRRLASEGQTDSRQPSVQVLEKYTQKEMK